jgi:polar amino acid transport system permease protein
MGDYRWRFDVVLEYLPYLLEGVKMTILVTAAAMVLGIIGGLIIALLRLSKSRVLKLIGRWFVDFFRSTPPLVQLIWIFYALPILVGVHIPALISGAVGLSLSRSAGLAEIFRGGILSIERGQREAALALGMTPSQAMRRVILPQAIRRMIPPITSVFISTLKGSSLVGVVALPDLMRQGNIVIQYTFRPLEILTTTAVIYFVLTYPQAVLSNKLYRRMRVS